MNLQKIPQENLDLVRKFGAESLSKLKEKPDFYTFKRNLIYSHRDFDKFFSALKKGKSCAIVSGFNASGTIHLGHKVVFDTNLFFQKRYNVPIFIPISDDESYVTGKVKDQKQALDYSIKLAKELIAYGFNPDKTHIIIDQIYTNIYNLAIKLSRRVTMSEIKATYGYKNEDNPGLFFYPAVQSAHILLPQECYGIKNVLVPIGPDEDSHIRICRDIALRAHYEKPAILHSRFLPGLDGEKMSKSRNNAIFLSDDEPTIRKKINNAYSGGRITAEEHRRYGGKPEEDVSIFYLTRLFLDEKESESVIVEYREGKLLSRDVKKMLADKVVGFVKEFQSRLRAVSKKELDRVIMKNNKQL
jgi:tryptophanyl-tRNA synthetase